MSNKAVIILDESGSMQSQISDAVGSIQSFISEHRKRTPDLLVTLVTFNTFSGEKYVWEDKPVQECTFSESDFRPNGGTPLLDAIGSVVNRVRRGKKDKVVVAILTDGQENSSTKFTRSQIKDLIAGKNPKNWQFAYLGVGFDDISDAVSSGFSIRSTGTYGTFAAASAGLATASADYYIGAAPSVNLQESEEDLTTVSN